MKAGKVFFCAGACACGVALAQPAVKDACVLGWWRFDDAANYLRDSSGYGSHLQALASGTAGSASGSPGGALDISTKGASVKATLGASAPAYNGTTSPYYTFATRFKSRGTVMSGLGALGVATEIKNVVNDTSGWHFTALRYQPDKMTGSSYAYMVVLDPRYNDGMNWIKADGTTDTTRNLEMGSNSSSFLMAVASGVVTIGGSLKGQSWYGYLDETMVVNRFMSKRELTRLWRSGETYVYCYAGNPSFASAGGWSTCEGTFNPTPGAMPGAAYIVDAGKTMAQGATATFGGDVAKRLSLTLGRLAELSYPEGTGEKTVGTVGNFAQNGAGTSITIHDLRLNDGTWSMAADGQVLNATYLDVEAPAAKPFAFVVASGCTATLNLANPTTGSGRFVKKGAGLLVVNGLAGTAGISMSEGRIQAPAIDTYEGGAVVVSGASPTTVARIAGGRIVFVAAAVPETGRAKVATLPEGYAGAVVDATDYRALGRWAEFVVEGRDVFLCRPSLRTAVLVR